MTRAGGMDLTERMLHLRQIPVATLVPPQVLRKIAAALIHRAFPEGAKVLHQGAPLEGMLLLTDGALSLVRNGAPFGELKAPQTVGFLPIVAGQDTPYDAITRTEVSAFELETDTLLELFADHFELLLATLRYLAERLYHEFQELPQEALGFPALDLGPVLDRPMDLAERILVFRRTSGFAAANVNALAVLSRQVSEEHIAAGTRLWVPGDTADRVLFVVHGRIHCRTPDGREFHYGAGTGVGGIESLAERPRWYTATAATDVIALGGHPENLVDLFEQQLRMAMDFIATLARAQIGLLERKAKLGIDPLASVRDVSKLGAVRVGA